MQLRWPGDKYYFATEGFQVDEVRLPEFRVRAEVDARDRAILGDSLSVRVSAE